MKVVVTGASGFLGRHVIAALEKTEREEEFQVIPVCRTTGPFRHPALVLVSEYLDTPAGDVLIHLAEDADRARVNRAVKGNNRTGDQVQAALLSSRFDRVIYASSAVLYGDESPEPHTVTDPVRITDVYTETKWRGEELALAHPSGAIARLANIYGPGMSASNVLSTILGQLPCQMGIEIWDGRPIRDMIWVADAARALASMALESARGVFNIGSGQAFSVLEIATTALRLVGQVDRPVIFTKPSTRDSVIRLDITRACELLHWQPSVSLEEGLRYLMNSEQS